MLTAASLLIVAGCKDDKAREAATAQAIQSTEEHTAVPAATASQAPVQKPAINTTTVGTLNMAISSKTAAKGSEACVAITARNFNRIVSMQYTVKWDNKVLKFKELRGFDLPGLGPGNFGTQLIEKEGLLTHSWLDANVRGITRPDGASLYDICFEVIGSAGSKSLVQFVNEPVIFEITNSDSQFLELKGEQGSIEVK